VRNVVTVSGRMMVFVMRWKWRVGNLRLWSSLFVGGAGEKLGKVELE
jgi:hypothetical protein